MNSKVFTYIKKIVAFCTAFCGGVSLVFLISGAGEPVIRLLFFVILFVAAINLAVYSREILAGRKKKPAGPPPGGRPGGQGGGGDRGGGDRGGSGGGGQGGGGQGQGGDRGGGSGGGQGQGGGDRGGGAR